MAGHSRPKDGVASRAYVPAIHVFHRVRHLRRGCPRQKRVRTRLGTRWARPWRL